MLLFNPVENAILSSGGDRTAQHKHKYEAIPLNTKYTLFKIKFTHKNSD